MIFLQEDEVLKDGLFLSKTRVGGDLFIRGPVNGCDLSQVRDLFYINENIRFIVIGSSIFMYNKTNQKRLSEKSSETGSFLQKNSHIKGAKIPERCRHIRLVLKC